jgi:hypothetical protein
LGPEHPDTIQSLDQLADLYREQGKYAEAEPLYRRTLAFYEQSRGAENSLTQLVRKHYTTVVRAVKRDARKKAWKRLFKPFSR